MISIVIPVYNGEKHLRETIQTIQRSEYRELEIIAVNDGSMDQSLQILEQLQLEDDRIKIYTVANSGVAAARNYGVSVANGEFLCFCDQDDMVEPFMYSRLYRRITEDDSDMAMCSSGRSIGGRKNAYDTLDTGVYEGQDVREKLLYPMLFTGYRVPYVSAGGNHYPNIWVCMFRRSFWDKYNLRFRTYVNFEDDLLVKTEALARAQRVSTIADIGYYWRIDLQSETYAHHFVQDIGAKQDAWLKDQLTSLRAGGADRRVLTAFARITRCKQYLDTIHYLTSREVRKTPAFIRNYCRENIYSRDFKDSIRAVRYLSKGRVKARVILPLLGLKLSFAAYLAEIILDKILHITLQSPALAKLERKIKR